MRPALLLFVALPLVALAADRVKQARENKTDTLKALFKEKQLPFPPEEVYLRAFKHEKVLEVWSGPKGRPLTLVRSFPICAASGELGPKRKEGDLQVPEGFYEIRSFNPTSNFHLSMEVSYPNRSDRALSDKEHPGGEIYLHGNCASIGCIAIEDDPIEEVYLLALDAKVRPVRIDVFPRRLDEAGLKASEGDPNLDFWKQLAPGFAVFEQTHRPPAVKIDAKTGAYTASSSR
jgi:murein L,D-transpeptidase YafK